MPSSSPACSTEIVGGRHLSVIGAPSAVSPPLELLPSVAHCEELMRRTSARSSMASRMEPHDRAGPTDSWSSPVNTFAVGPDGIRRHARRPCLRPSGKPPEGWRGSWFVITARDVQGWGARNHPCVAGDTRRLVYVVWPTKERAVRGKP